VEIEKKNLFPFKTFSSSISFSFFTLSFSLLPFLLLLISSHLCSSSTCFAVLGMVGQTEAGREQLRRSNWVVAEGQVTGVAVPLPTGLARFFRVAPTDWTGEWVERMPLRYCNTYTDERAELLKCIGDLATNITLGDASKGLKKLRHKHLEWFQTPEIAWDIFRTVEHNHFRLPIRRFIWDLFGSVQYSPADLDRLAAANSNAAAVSALASSSSNSTGGHPPSPSSAT
jgi:rapamycin-insensitive companion of mTOR